MLIASCSSRVARHELSHHIERQCGEGVLEFDGMISKFLFKCFIQEYRAMASWIGWAEISVGCEQRKIYLEHKDEFTKIFERAFILSSTLLVVLSV